MAGSSNLTADLVARPLTDLHTGGAMSPDTIISGIKPIKALQLLYYLINDPMSLGWEERLILHLKAKSLTHFSLDFGAARSYQDESDRAVAQDNPLVGAAVTLMIVYVTCLMGGRPPTSSRCLLGFTVVFNVGFALVIGFGLCGHSGVGYNIISFMAIFILFGIGIDDMFIILGAVANAPEVFHNPKP